LPSIISNSPPGFVWILIVAYFAFFAFADAVVAGTAKKTSANSGIKANLRLRRMDVRNVISCPPQSVLNFALCYSAVLDQHRPRAIRFRTGATTLVLEWESVSAM